MKKILSLMLAILLICAQGASALEDEAVEKDRTVADFSWKLFAQAAQSGEPNVVISPISAYLALAMAAEGAGGDTAKQFDAVLGQNTDALAAFCMELTKALADTKESTVLKIANSGWLDESFTADPDYLKTISDDMDADVFVRALAADETREEINAWVSGATNSLIPSLLNENLPEGTALALINTLYFNGTWGAQFDANNTADNVFHLASGSEVTAAFMTAPESDQSYIEADGVEGVLLPYDDRKTALIALRATDGRSAQELAQALTPASLAQYIASASQTYMTLSMPKFTLSYSMTMNDALKAMGLNLAFDPDAAEFSGMGESPNGSIFISKVLQKVKIGVNERGTEAAAATIVEMEATAIMPMDKPMVLNLDSRSCTRWSTFRRESRCSSAAWMIRP
jgi:serpin B